MTIKEDVEDPRIIHRIHSILIPREFTRLDEIADILFSTAEDIRQEPSTSEEAAVAQPRVKSPKFTPVAFHDACISRVSKLLGVHLIKRTRARYTSPDKVTVVNCAVSKEHNSETNPNYWYAFHPHQREFLSAGDKAYVVFGCGSSKRVLAIPFSEFDSWVGGMWTTEKDGRVYWHVVIDRKGEDYQLRRRKGKRVINLTPYLVPGDS